MNPPFTIRQATPEDAPAISALIISLSQTLLTDPKAPASAAPFFETVSPDSIAGYISGGRFIYHLAVHHSLLAGAVAIRDKTHLYHLFVAKPHQGQHLATTLWKTARNHAETTATIKQYTVNASLDAIPIYTHFGFTKTGEAIQTHGLAFIPMALDLAGAPGG